MSGLSDRAQGLGLVLFATLGWSLSGLFVRLMPGLDSWQINGARGLFCGLCLYIYLFAKHGAGLRASIARIPAAAFLFSAICFASGTTFYVSSLTLTNTATVSVIGACSPLVTALLSPWITGERPHPLSWLSAFLALGGMMVIAREGLALGNGLGILLALCVPATFAMQTLLLRRYRDYDMMSAIGFGGFLSFIVSGLVVAASGTHHVTDYSAHDLALLAAMGGLQLALPLIAYGRGAKFLPAIVLSLISMLDAVLNPLWSFLFTGEVPAASAVIGGGIIIAAVTLSILATQVPKLRTA